MGKTAFCTIAAIAALIFLIVYLGLFVYGVGSILVDNWKMARRK